MWSLNFYTYTISLFLISSLEFNEIFFFSGKVIKNKKNIYNALTEPLFELITPERLQNPSK